MTSPWHRSGKNEYNSNNSNSSITGSDDDGGGDDDDGDGGDGDDRGYFAGPILNRVGEFFALSSRCSPLDQVPAVGPG